jgi:hypothetical protein
VSSQKYGDFNIGLLIFFFFFFFMNSRERLAVFPTKQTPIYDIQFTDRNLCLVAGAFTPQKAAEH